jgi:hypothetical protein
MSEDIVVRLRDNLNFHMEAQSLMHEAADEILRLRRFIAYRDMALSAGNQFVHSSTRRVRGDRLQPQLKPLRNGGPTDGFY